MIGNFTYTSQTASYVHHFSHVKLGQSSSTKLPEKTLNLSQKSRFPVPTLPLPTCETWGKLSHIKASDFSIIKQRGRNEF